MKPLRLALLAVLVAMIAATSSASIVACGSDSSSSTTPDPDAGLDAAVPTDLDAAPVMDAADAAAAPRTTSPYGTPYPTKSLGTKARTGTIAGSVLTNYDFAGYAPNATSASKVYFADVFDPEGRTHDLVAVLLVAAWDSFSKGMLTKLVGNLPSRVAVFVVLTEATEPGRAATLGDLTALRDSNNLPSVTFGLDPLLAKLTGFDERGFPVVVLVDARTMEIVSRSLGALNAPKTELEAAAAEIRARPPTVYK